MCVDDWAHVFGAAVAHLDVIFVEVFLEIVIFSEMLFYELQK